MKNNMYTSVYFPGDAFVGADRNFTAKGDSTSLHNHFNLNGPSYCVRLWVFEMPND